MRLTTIFAFTAFMLTVPLANWLIANVGTICIPNGPCLVPVGFGLMAPSGVIVIGLALVLRDWLHEIAGWKSAMLAICLGAALSFVVSEPSIALASAIAMMIAETADLVIYSYLRSKSKPIAVFGSQIVGAAVDSTIFVIIAFGSLDFSVGTTLAKIYAGAVVAIVMLVVRRRSPVA